MHELMPIERFRQNDTTASWNFFILRIDIDPPAVSTGLQNSAAYSTIMSVELACAELSSSYGSAKMTTTRTPATVKKIITISNALILSLRMKKAKTIVTSGPILFTIAIIVSGRYFVTEQLMMFVMVPQIERKTSGPADLRSMSSQTACFKSLLTMINWKIKAKPDLSVSIQNGDKSGLRSYRYLAQRKQHEYSIVQMMQKIIPLVGQSPFSSSLRSVREIDCDLLTKDLP